MIKITNLKKELKFKADQKQAKLLQRFFKTGPGEYGEGDIFLGIKVGDSRKIAQKYKDLSLKDTEKLLHSKIHEQRLVALLILVQKFQEGDENLKEKVSKIYLKNTNYINNWDLVDLSSHKIVGEYLFKKPKDILYKMAKSKLIWDRRIAVISTFYFIKNNEFKESLKIAKILLNDSHDLMHKAVGWMLREVGNRSLKTEEDFLKNVYKKMPRTMLRYAIEKFPEKKRQDYLKGKI
jgi:3-methyladenine DNA glycosylase AlkD